MAARKSGLGKGLDTLIPKQVVKPAEANNETSVKGQDPLKKETSLKKDSMLKTESAVSIEINSGELNIVDGVVNLKVTVIEPNREQPRRKFDEDALLELADSIKQFGIVQPLVVQKKDKYYEIIAGERRWRAAKLAGLKEVPVVIKNYSHQEAVEISLIENIQREDLNPIEEAMAYKRLLTEFSLKQDEVAERVSKSRTAVTNSMRLLKLGEKVQQMVIDEMLTTGHARALLSISDEEKQYIVASEVFDEKLSVRETERLVKSLLAPKQEPKVKEVQNEFVYKDLEEKLKNIIGTKVSVNHKANNKGKIEIEYYSNEDLERIMDMFQSIHVS